MSEVFGSVYADAYDALYEDKVLPLAWYNAAGAPR